MASLPLNHILHGGDGVCRASAAVETANLDNLLRPCQVPHSDHFKNRVPFEETSALELTQQTATLRVYRLDNMEGEAKSHMRRTVRFCEMGEMVGRLGLEPRTNGLKVRYATYCVSDPGGLSRA